MEPEDLIRLVRQLIAPTAGGSGSATALLASLLGKDWWRTFPIENIEPALEQLERGSQRGTPLARHTRALVDYVKAERIAAKGVDEPLDEDKDVWATTTDRPGAAKPRAGGAAEIREGMHVRRGPQEFTFNWVVVSVFQTTSGETRVVCESQSDEAPGFLYVFKPEHLSVVKE